MVERVRMVWDTIVVDSKRGFPHDARIRQIETEQEEMRQAIEGGALRNDLDWEGDWLRARDYHYVRIDHASAIAAQRQGIEGYWANWAHQSETFLQTLSAEGTKAILLLHCASALAALAVLSGQITQPSDNVRIAAKIMITAAVIGLAATLLGELILFHVIGKCAPRHGKS